MYEGSYTGLHNLKNTHNVLYNVWSYHECRRPLLCLYICISLYTCNHLGIPSSTIPTTAASHLLRARWGASSHGTRGGAAPPRRLGRCGHRAGLQGALPNGLPESRCCHSWLGWLLTGYRPCRHCLNKRNLQEMLPCPFYCVVCSVEMWD